MGARVRELAEELQIPGVAVGVFHDDEERYAYHGVTSVENPLPVDEHTLFQFGSTGKTYTSVALLRLVEAGKVDLDATVRTYVPELTLRDPEVAERVTVLQLLNHTAGWDGDFFEDTGDGDDSLARFVERMATLQQLTPPGSIVSYNNAALSLAGRIIEKVTGSSYERAVKELVLDPIGLNETLFFPNDIMSRRFVVGHRRETDGSIRVLRPWAMPRSGNAMGGLSASAPDQIRWARFHLDHGRTVDGTQVVAAELIDRMQQPTAEMPGSDLGDAVGISWLLSEAGGEKRRLPRRIDERASSPGSRWCRSVDSRSSRSRTPSRTVRSSTVRSPSGRSRRTWASSSPTWSPRLGPRRHWPSTPGPTRR